MIRAALAALFAFGLLVSGACAPTLAADPPPLKLEVATARVTTADGKTHRYRVEVARTAAEQSRGLMYRKAMLAKAGMIFPFATPRFASFFMKNTYLPLAIIFVDADGRVLNVGEGVPLTTENVVSDGIAAAVLELNLAEARRIGLKPGDRVSWSG